MNRKVIIGDRTSVYWIMPTFVAPVVPECKEDT